MDVVEMAQQLEAPWEPLITLIARKRPLTGMCPEVLSVSELTPELAAAKVAVNERLWSLLGATPGSDPILVSE